MVMCLFQNSSNRLLAHLTEYIELDDHISIFHFLDVGWNSQ